MPGDAHAVYMTGAASQFLTLGSAFVLLRLKICLLFGLPFLNSIKNDNWRDISSGLGDSPFFPLVR